MAGTAYHLEALHDVDNLIPRDQQQPEPGPHDVIVRVRAASLNRRDLVILEGLYPIPPEPGLIPLADGAGDVVAVGSQVRRVAVGDRVSATYFVHWVDGAAEPQMLGEQYGASRDGMLATYARVHEDSVVRLPTYLSYTEAATLPCAAVTAWGSLNGRRPPAAGDTVLTVGSGPVAVFGVQLAIALGAQAIAVTSGAAKAARFRELGATPVDRQAYPDWHEVVLKLTEGIGAGHVLDAVGPATLAKSVGSAAFDAEIAVVGTFPAGGAHLDDSLFYGGMFTIRKLAVGSRATFESLTSFLDSHAVRPVIDRVFSFGEARQAYRHLRDGDPFGKVLITID